MFQVTKNIFGIIVDEICSNDRFALVSVRTSRKGDDGGRGARALRVLDDLGRLSLHDGDARVGGAEVDADDVAGDAVGLVPHIAAVEDVVL